MNYDKLYESLRHTGMAKWLETLPQQIDEKIYQSNNGNLSRWLEALNSLPELNASNIELNHAHVSAGCDENISTEDQQQLEKQLRTLMPWRKGPYKLFGLEIDTEWHSDWKWDRLSPHISDLKNRVILDVGCGNGYHSWRMAGAGAQLVIGIDPSLLFVMQYQAIKKYLPDYPVYVLPLKMEELPPNLPHFDTAFSMGVLYHRRSPLDHLVELKNCLKPGGELVLETLIVDGDENTVLVPQDRYAKMRNVWFLPSCDALSLWLQRVGFTDIKLVDINQTSLEEQRVTKWMDFESLKDFLAPNNINKTIEGYQAPTRAIFVAKKPT